jgi:hypothetical protein
MSTVKKCPGLKSKSGYKWWIPFGKNADEMTLCDECKQPDEEYILSDVLYSCNCDGFLIKNKASNGIFNVSMWYDENKKIYPVHTSYVVNDAQDGPTYDLVVPENGKFNVFIDSELKKHQYFKYELYIDNALFYTSDIYFKKSAMDETVFNVLNIPIEAYNFLAESKKPYITDTVILTVKINVYNFSSTTVDTTSNEYYGDYTVINPKTLGVKINATPSNFINMIKPDYKFRQPLINQGSMKIFTVKPIVMNFRTCVQPNQSNQQISVDTEVKHLLRQEKNTIEKMLHNFEKEQMAGITKQVELEEKIMNCKQKLEQCSLYC